MPPDISRYVMLGPQSPAETISATLKQLELTGTVCSITAGWQEREAELGDLEEAIHLPVVDLALYRRAESVLHADEELARAHRERQTLLREQQRLYRMRLYHYAEALGELMSDDGSPVLLDDHRRAALSALRTLDRQHLSRIKAIHDEFKHAWRLHERDGIAREIEKLAHVIDRCSAVLIAGGHVGVLTSRARLFALDRLLVGKTVVGWSAGAMLLAGRIVLFDDHTPHFYRVPELFDAGMDFVHRVVPLPSASTRLELHNRERAAVLARRFSPDRCVTLDPGAAVVVEHQVMTRCEGAMRVARDGSLKKLRAR